MAACPCCPGLVLDLPELAAWAQAGERALAGTCAVRESVDRVAGLPCTIWRLETATKPPRGRPVIRSGRISEQGSDWSRRAGSSEDQLGESELDRGDKAAEVGKRQRACQPVLQPFGGTRVTEQHGASPVGHLA